MKELAKIALVVLVVLIAYDKFVKPKLLKMA